MAHFKGEMIQMQCLFTCSVNKSCYCAKPREFVQSSGTILFTPAIITQISDL